MNNPQRCFSCNKIIGNLWDDYEKMKENGEEFNDICSKLDIERYCCKRMFMSQKNFYNKFSKFTDKNLRLITKHSTSENFRLYNTK